MNNERAQLALDASLLSPGSTVRMVCPFCGGGSTKEASLALTHTEEGALLFYCHRAHCTAKGVLGGNPTYARRADALQERRQYDLTVYSSRFPVWVVDQCGREWGIDPLNAGWRWDTHAGRIIMPVQGPAGEIRGYVARVAPVDGRPEQPKALSYPAYLGESWAHWHIQPNTELVIVEDIPSAVRVSLNGYAAVALIGTNMSQETEREIVDTYRLWKFSRVLVALDKDAARRTFLHAKSLMMRGLPAEPLLIEKDFKNMTDEEIICTVSNDS